MAKKRVCIIAQFPPPIHGLSKAVETLYDSDILNDEFELIKVDITNNKKFLSNYRKISKTDADLFYFTISQSIGGNLRDLSIMRLLRKQGKKCLIHLHGGYYRKLYDNDMKIFQKRWNEKALRQIDGAIVLGDSLKSIFEGLVDENKIFVVPNCVDDEYLLKDLSVKPQDEPYHILYLSNFIRSKGYDVVLKMAKSYKENPGSKKLHFDFAGKFFETKEKFFFESYVKENQLESIVSYHGVVSGDEKRELLKNSTFFILPTTYPKEGQPISILEAMGNGLIILTTIHAGIPDIVQDGINGCILRYQDDIHIAYLDFVNSLSQKDMLSISGNNHETTKKLYVENTYISNLRESFLKA